VGLLDTEIYEEIRRRAPSAWDAAFAEDVYRSLAAHHAYVTNLAKCTQPDARPLPPATFRAGRELLIEEIRLTRPRAILALGNMVSSILLEQPIMVGSVGTSPMPLSVGEESYAVFPTHYPVGQGMRNLPLAISRIRSVLASLD
jgi:uracil-DNA glycosylase